MKIILNSPVWYIAICIIIAGLGAYFLYRNDSKLKELPKSWKRLLGVFRFASLFFVFFLLLEPLLEYTKIKVEKPIVVLIQDNSSSVLTRADSIEFEKNYTDQIQELSIKLSSGYEVVPYLFGKELKEGAIPDYTSASTNISAVFAEIQERYYNRNLGAIILSSDGIYNQGSNPIYEAKKLKNIPIFSILLGDSTPQKDLWIEDVVHNKLAYQGNTFLVEVVLKSNDINEKSTVVSIQKSGKVLSAKTIEVSSEKGIQKVRFEIEANEMGLQKYTVVAKEIHGEFTKVNNVSSFYVEVLKSKQKIMLLANSPHPDLQAIKLGLSSNENYDIEVKLAEDLPKDFNSFDLVITHNLPTRSYPLTSLTKTTRPLFMFLGNQTDYTKLNELGIGLKIENVKEYTEAGVYQNSDFSGFVWSDLTMKLLQEVSPLQVPFSTSYKLGNSFNTALYQRIGMAKSVYPLVTFGSFVDKKIGFFVGEGIWRWRMQEFVQNESNEGFDGLLQQMAQLLVAKDDKSKFRVSGKPTYENSEDIKFSAEVYNKSYEPVNNGEVEFLLTNENKEDFDYLFSPKGDNYILNIGKLSPGKYSYKSIVKLEGEILTKEGDFSVTETKLELKNSQANHAIMHQLASITGGKSISVSQIGSLVDLISTDDSMKSVSYEEKEVDDLIEIKYLFLFILLFLSIEWFVRKRNGAY